MNSAHAPLFYKVQRIAFAAKQRVLDKFSGMYTSRFRGPGLELEDIREFQNGDDVRAISWAKTAQMAKPYVKSYREERDLNVMLVADISGSFELKTRYGLKRERLAEVGALLAMSAAYNHDRVGLMLFSDTVELYLPPKRGLRHSVRIVRELMARPAVGTKTCIADALRTLYKLLPKRAVVFLLSDFIDDSFDNELLLTSKKDDLIAVRLFDPYEKSLPKLGLAAFQDIETRASWLVDVTDDQVEAYTEAAAHQDERMRKLFVKTKTDCIDIDTQESFLEQIIRYFLLRKKRVT